MKDKIKLEPFKETDIDELMGIEDVSFSMPWPKESYLNICKRKEVRFILAKLESEIIGYIVYEKINNNIEAYTIAVKEKYRKKDIASIMFEYMIEDSKKMGAQSIFGFVRPSNTSSRALLKKYNFSVIGIRPHYYFDNGEDGFIVKRSLKW